MKTTLTPINAWQPGRRYAFDLKRELSWHPDVVEDDFWKVAEKVWDYTACAALPLYNYYCALKHVFAEHVEGDVVECGVFLGGSVMFAAEIMKRCDYSETRRLFALDTFSGFVRHTPGVDVDYEGKPVCLVEQSGNDFSRPAIDNMRSVGFERLEIVVGDVLETIPNAPIDRIAILRLDTDTYDTTKLELEQFHPKMSRGGIVIIDDYGFNKGCKEAVDEFIGGKGIFLQRIDRHCRAWQVA